MAFDVARVLSGYDPSKITIATACSHSSLQIFHGARQEGFRTLGIAVGETPRYYEAFPLARPDEFLLLKDYREISDHVEALRRKNVVLIPHGSFVEYLGATRFAELPVPSYGNRKVLEWESDREKAREWLEGAGIKMPRTVTDPRTIDRPVIVKYHGAKGGRGFYIAKSYDEYKRKVDPGLPHTIQEFVIGTRYYLHYFYSPIASDGYRLARGGLQLLSIDRRDESNIDEAHRLGSIEELDGMGIKPTFVVTGNIPMTIRESLLPEVFRMGAKVVERSDELFGGIWGPFALETVVTDQLEFRVFEISARIVAGTNPFISGSPYADFIEPGLSTGRRIAKELRLAAKTGRLREILT
ncbi:MAG: formate--phosphoribosylaminoimidazolecarboxamide ligase [Methanobacteriota archaeon]